MVVDTKLYEILGVNPDASEQDIKKAYMKMARQLHPDKNRDDPHATEKFQELNEAYEILKDPSKRERYDSLGPDGLRGSSGEGSPEFEDILSRIFGGGFRTTSGKPRTRDRGERMEVELSDLYNGADKPVEIKHHVPCKACKGLGTKSGKEPPKCEFCHGTGGRNIIQESDGMTYEQTVECDHCHGTGELSTDDDQCPICLGEKIVEETKTLTVHIQKGMENFEEITFKGESDDLPGAEPGDYIIQLNQKPNQLFERSHANLLFKKSITLYEALFGTHFIVEHLDGRKLVVDTSEGETISPESVRVIRSEGMPIKGTQQKGDLFIKFAITIPDKESLTPELKQALAKVQPPSKEAVNFNDESTFVTEAFESNLSEFNGGSEEEDERNEAYMADDGDDEEGGQPGCQPM